MATEALKSNQITNRDATPRVPNLSLTEGGFCREDIDYVTTTSGVTSGSTYRIANVPSAARVSQILFYAGAMTAGAFDVGVYRNTADGGAVVDADFFASAVSAASAVEGTDITNESSTYTLDKRIQPLWQAIGMSADPGGTLDIVCTSTATITAGAKLGLLIRWTV
jgi:hypothetical protein